MADSSARLLFASAKRFLSDLPEWMQVWPAHGAGSACGKALGAVPQSTVGYEKRFNAALLATTSEKAFVDFILDGQPEPPSYFARMKYENRDGPAILGGLPKPRQITDASELASLAATSQILDVRAWSDFRNGHLRGALFTPLDGSFSTIVGSYADPKQDAILICDAAKLDECVRAMVRVGIDRAVAWATPATLAQCGGLVTTKEVDVAGARKLVDQGIAVLDVRKATEFSQGHIDGATNIAHTRLAAHLNAIPKGSPILCHCKAGMRSAYASALLERNGFDVTNLAGGFDAWLKAGAPAMA
jgi:hydroxyacylglutathione hydrolase